MFDSVEDILEHARSFHRNLGTAFDRLEHNTGSEKLRLMLDYLAKHESSLARSLKEFQKGSSETRLHQYFVHGPPAELMRELSEIDVAAQDSVEDIQEKLLKLDNALIEIYSQLAEKARTPEIADIFQALHETATRERNNFVRGVQDL